MVEQRLERCFLGRLGSRGDQTDQATCSNNQMVVDVSI